MTLLDAIHIWLKDDKSLKHFSIEHSDCEDFDADWITCPCSSFILVSIYSEYVMVMTKPVGEGRLRLPVWYKIPASHPQFFDMVKYSLTTYHEQYL